MDPVFLARLQFGVTIGFHFIFPPLTIGLAWLLVVAEWRGWRRADEGYVQLSRFFAKVLGLTFAVGVATGIVMEFQFGTNWASYSKFVGDIFGAPLAAEGVFAFFLESGFLGLYLFGRGRVSKGLHWFSSLMVAVGSTLSAFWIIVANSWQQTPAGFHINEAMGRAELTDFWAAVFNPSTIVRYTHTLAACLAAGAFLMAGISAYFLLSRKDVHVGKYGVKLGVIGGFAAALLTLMPTGHHHARQVAQTQPAKFAAIEGLYESQEGAPMVLFGIPVGTQDEPGLLGEIGIPRLLSWLATSDPNARLTGIEDIPVNDRPPLRLTFISFHTMVGLGMLFIMLSGLGVIFLWRRTLYEKRWMLRTLVFFTPLPVIAAQFGWITAEVGRQPFIVYPSPAFPAGLRTIDSASVTVSSGEILFSLIMFGLIYMLLGALYLFLLVRKVKHGPDPVGGEEVA